MILLIHSTGGASHVGIYVFKFHYDSINSMSSVDLSHPDAHLNSIMILLIQMQHHATLTYDINLNSIMILLIHHNTWV